MNNRFNFAWDALLPDETATLEAIRVAVDAREEAARAAKQAEWERLVEANGRGRTGDALVEVVVIRVTKTTIVTRDVCGSEFTFFLSSGYEKGGGYFGSRRLELTHVPASLLALLVKAGQDPKNGWARAVASKLAGPGAL